MKKPIPGFKEGDFHVAAFDLDETTLHLGKMSERTAYALDEVRKAGILTVITTGRDLSQIPADIVSHFDYAVLSNGAHIAKITTGEGVPYAVEESLISAIPIEKEVACSAVEEIRALGGESYMLMGGALRGSHKCVEMTEDAWQMPEEKIIPIWGWHALSCTEDLPGYILSHEENRNFKMKCFFPKIELADRAVLHFKENPRLSVIDMHDRTIELTANGVNKGMGLIMLCEACGFTIKQAVAFGDGGNDLPTLTSGCWSVAMGNAIPQIKEVADSVCGDIKEDGSASALLEMLKH